LRYANQVGSAGHVAMMRAAKPGMMEYQVDVDVVWKLCMCECRASFLLDVGHWHHEHQYQSHS